jgi:hypothetical protein
VTSRGQPQQPQQPSDDGPFSMLQLFGYYEDDDGPHWDFLQVRFIF